MPLSKNGLALPPSSFSVNANLRALGAMKLHRVQNASTSRRPCIVIWWPLALQMQGLIFQKSAS